jgi:hypothetical protein
MEDYREFLSDFWVFILVPSCPNYSGYLRRVPRPVWQGVLCHPRNGLMAVSGAPCGHLLPPWIPHAVWTWGCPNPSMAPWAKAYWYKEEKTKWASLSCSSSPESRCRWSMIISSFQFGQTGRKGRDCPKLRSHGPNFPTYRKLFECGCDQSSRL